MQVESITKARNKKSRYGKAKQTKGPSIEKILSELCEIFEVSEEEVMSDKKNEDLAKVRRYYYYVASMITNVTQDSIACLINRERSCVVHHIDKIKGWIKVKEPTFLEQWAFYTEQSLIWKEYNTK